MADFVKVGTKGDPAPGHGKQVEVGGKKIALFNVDGAYYAIDDTCTHRGGPLSEGELSGAEVTCPWHGAVFDVKTGNVLGPPAAKGVSKYNVRISGESVEVEV
jgi:3-phenylpropionate/trans-cinnamate dioxygenase ferredoxin component